MIFFLEDEKDNMAESCVMRYNTIKELSRELRQKIISRQ